MSETTTTNGTIIKRDVVDATAAQIRKFIESGTLHVPEDYSPENALKQAWLLLQTVVDKDKRPALQVCTTASVANALLDMVIQGLNPAKKQCYFIVYGNQLTMSRSYHGDIAIAERVKPGIMVAFQVIYKGDVCEYEIERGLKRVVTHKQKLENVKPENILGAYCEVYDEDGALFRSEIMTYDRIKQSWAMSKTYSYNVANKKEGTHQTYADSMCLRTVIRKTCLPIINKSNDAQLLAAVKRQDELSAEVEIEAEAAEHANKEPLAIEAVAESAPAHVVMSEPEESGQPVLVGGTEDPF